MRKNKATVVLYNKFFSQPLLFSSCAISITKLVRNLLLLLRGSTLAWLTGGQVWRSNSLFQPPLLWSLVFSSVLDFSFCAHLF